MTIRSAASWDGVVSYYARCNHCLYLSEPYPDEVAAEVLGAVHHCD
jgi:hypothetical protein